MQTVPTSSSLGCPCSNCQSHQDQQFWLSLHVLPEEISDPKGKRRVGKAASLTWRTQGASVAPCRLGPDLLQSPPSH